MTPRYNEYPVVTNNIWKRQNYSKICGNEPHYNEIPAIANWFWQSQRTIYPANNEYFVLSLAVSKHGMMMQMVDKPNTTPIGQDRETLNFKALLYLNVAVHAQVCRLFCVVYIPLFSLVQLGYLDITNIFAVNQVLHYNGVFAIANFFFGTVTLRYSGCIANN